VREKELARIFSVEGYYGPRMGRLACLDEGGIPWWQTSGKFGLSFEVDLT
jgi:hypothetical protein